MPNPYYNRETDLVPNTKVSTADIELELDAIVAGFDLLGDPTGINTGTNVNGGTDTGTTDNYVVDNVGTGSSTVVDGQIVTWTPNSANTGASVIDVNGSGNIVVVRNDGTALQPGDLIPGLPVMMIYDATNNRWVLVGSTAEQVKEQFRPSVIIDSSTARTLAPSDENAILVFTSEFDVTATVSPDSAVLLPIGFICHLHQQGAGRVTLAPAVGVTLDNAVGLGTRAQYSSVSIIKTAANRYKLVGDMGTGT